eukprot:CAMPEP_0203760474 /NCGR_PEP_ID=MMETSP0098-20131031/13756_1 /ASSEMBLY_ACC=CAM_ASM_000208 /TAXON_ID=96639 /ORGANISM=" , Strain NY0313808BC1" /LENGTH=216 /DNA_ID=CAMNT_0050654043 /DNA_START=304 /DNA_END=951 /DNA_ORIENTATION=-
MEELSAYIGKDFDDHTLSLLITELTRGETIVGTTEDGSVIRVVSVAKPILLDSIHGELLVEVLQTKRGKTKIKATGMSEKFDPLKETSVQACIRAMKEELRLDPSTLISDDEKLEDMFSQKCLRLVETALSDKYDGLKSEYHLYIHMLRPCFVRYLQEGGIVRRGELVKIEESGGDAQLDPKTLWWSWVAYNTEDEIKSYLETISKDAGIAEDLPW